MDHTKIDQIKADPMDIKQKIILSENPIHFFKQGNFIRLINQSLYVVCEYHKISLKPSVRLIPTLNKIIISSGFPVTLMLKHFPNANPTDYGYSLFGQFDLLQYHNWYQKICSQSLKNSY